MFSMLAYAQGSSSWLAGSAHMYFRQATHIVAAQLAANTAAAAAAAAYSGVTSPVGPPPLPDAFI
jgi:hypothetical protein